MLDRLALLKYRNARGSHIYIRPSDEHRFTVLDDLSEASLARLPDDSFNPYHSLLLRSPAPAAADIAFCVAAYANGMTEDRIERALEDDYLSRDSSISKRAAYIWKTMELAGACLADGARISPANIELTSMLSQPAS